MSMRRQDFHYHLPKALIAQYPTQQRRDSRLLVLDKHNGGYEDQPFTAISQLLKSGDLLVMNDTRVIPARLHGKKATGGQIEVLVERILSETELLAQIRASKSPKIDSTLHFDNDYTARVVGREQDFYRIQFNGSLGVLSVLQDIGHMPLPPYIERQDEQADSERYQTVYARHPGAVAAPTAGLHFDESMLTTLRDKGIQTAYVTLHVGAGTFQPMRVDNIAEHRMHKEWIDVSATTVEQITQTQQAGGRVIAIGTTTVRCLETAALTGQLMPYQGDTDIFITPGFSFNVVDALLTNFHLPESTLLMLICAFAGYEHTMQAYQHAVEQAYRFFSYGDAMFIH